MELSQLKEINNQEQENTTPIKLPEDFQKQTKELLINLEKELKDCQKNEYKRKYHAVSKLNLSTAEKLIKEHFNTRIEKVIRIAHILHDGGQMDTSNLTTHEKQLIENIQQKRQNNPTRKNLNKFLDTFDKEYKKIFNEDFPEYLK